MYRGAGGLAVGRVNQEEEVLGVYAAAGIQVVHDAIYALLPFHRLAQIGADCLSACALRLIVSGRTSLTLDRCQQDGVEHLASMWTTSIRASYAALTRRSRLASGRDWSYLELLPNLFCPLSLQFECLRVNVHF